MSPRYYIETTAAGPQFVSLKRSRSHNHKHHHHRHHQDVEYYYVSREEWNTLKERVRILEDNNKSLITENNDLRACLSTTQAEANRLEHIVIPQLQSQVSLLHADNAGLRKSLDNAADLAAKYQADIVRLEEKICVGEKQLRETKADNGDLRSRIRQLTRQLEDSVCRLCRGSSDIRRELEYWKDQGRHWKAKFEDLKARHQELIELLDSRTERMKAYEEILKRRCII